MSLARIVIAVVLALFAGTACSDAAVSAVAPTSDAPAVASANTLVAAMVGAPLAYDATKSGTVFTDPALKGLAYAITLNGGAGGLSAARGIITGVPTAPGILTATVTATDALGRSARDAFAIVVFASGLPAPSPPAASYAYSDATAPLPPHFSALVNGTRVTATDNTPPINPITDAVATLGRVLFYDTRLSADDGTACASCHVQSLGFSDALQRSVGFAGGLTDRHAPALGNARFHARGRFLWDERAPSLEAQVLVPIQNSIEMGMTLDGVVMKLMATS